MPDNQHRKLYSMTYYPRQANVHYAVCGVCGFLTVIAHRCCRRCCGVGYHLFASFLVCDVGYEGPTAEYGVVGGITAFI